MKFGPTSSLRFPSEAKEAHAVIHSPRVETLPATEGSTAGSPPAFHPLYRRDCDLTLHEDIALRRLLRLSFPFHPVFLRRRYRHSAPPEHRWLIHDEAGHLIAHAAAYDRQIVTEQCLLLFIGGIAEVCVHPDARGKGLLKKLLAAIHTAYTERNVPFCMLFGTAKLYRSSGYMPISNQLLTRGHLLPLFLNPFHGTPMIRPLGEAVEWPTGTIDLCGPIF